MLNNITIAAFAVSALASVAVAARAETAPGSPATTPAWQVYGSYGYSAMQAGQGGFSADLGAVTGRVGVRYQRYVGAEVEVSAGVSDDTIKGVKVALSSQGAAYAVFYLPLSPKADLFARAGYGSAKVKASYAGVSGSASGDVWAFGVGGQYFVTAHDGVRAEYTRFASTDTSKADVDSVTVSYVRKF